MRKDLTLLVLLTAGFIFFTRSASGANHLWDLTELYTNSSGSVEFVEMFNEFSGEGFISGLTITAMDSTNTLTHTFTFPSNTTDLFNTANKHLLIATPGFGGLPGGVTPDFTIPANFLFINGGTVTYSGSLDSINYASLPTNGLTSVNKDPLTHLVTVGTNSPTNFGGNIGSVPEPGTVMVILGGAVLVGMRRQRM
jgi:hypothetical protein